MKLASLTIIMGLLLCSITSVYATQTRVPASSVAPIQLEHSIDSKLFDEKRHFRVRLPKSYHKSTRAYPVVYLLDADPFYQGELVEHALSVVSRLEEQSGIPEIIVVIIQSNNWYTDTIVKPEPFIQYLTQELSVFVDTQYRTLGDKSNILVGHSYAAAFVSRAAALVSGKMGLYLAISPIYPDVEYVSEIQNTYKNMSPSESSLYLFKGDEELFDVKTLQQAIQNRQQKRLHFTFDHIAEEGHGSIWPVALSHGLRRFFSDYRSPSIARLLEEEYQYTDIETYFDKRQKKYQIRTTAADLQAATTKAAQTYLNAKKFSLAFPLWEKSESKFKGYFMNGYADRFYQKGDYTSALIIWKKMVEWMPEKSGAFAGLAKGYEANKQNVKALAAYTKAVELARKNHHPKLEKYQQRLARLKRNL